MHVHLFHFEKRQARFKVITDTYGIYTHNMYQANEGQIICIYFNNKMFSMLIHAGYEGYRHFRMDTPKKGIEKDPVVLNLFSYFLTLI